MRNDIAPNRLLRVWIEHRTGSPIHLRNHLIRNHNRDAELVCQPLQGAHELRQVGLPAAEFPAAAVVGAVERGGGVDDEEREARLAHHGARLVQQLQLMVAVVRAGIRHVVQYLLAREPVPIRHGQQPHWPEGALGVDVQAFPLAAAHVEGELAGDGQGVAYLRLAGAELAEDLGDAAGFDAAGEKGVELFGAGGDGDEFGAALVHFGGGGEAHGDEFGGWCEGGAGLVDACGGNGLTEGGEKGGYLQRGSWWLFAPRCLLFVRVLSVDCGFASVHFLNIHEIPERGGA